MISERIKAALARSKSELGLRHPKRCSKAFRRRIRALCAEGKRKAAMERAQAYRMHIEWALRHQDKFGRPVSLSAAAQKLNAQDLPSPMGGRWSSINVGLMASRLRLPLPPPTLPLSALRQRLGAIFKLHPEFTPQQIIDSLGTERPAGQTRVWRLLRKCRLAAAEHSSVHKQIGWQLDRRTAARVRISAIWKRHPEFTGRQVLEKLGPEHSVRVHWVQKTLREFCQASARQSPEQRQIGRTIYSRRW